MENINDNTNYSEQQLHEDTVSPIRLMTHLEKSNSSDISIVSFTFVSFDIFQTISWYLSYVKVLQRFSVVFSLIKKIWQYVDDMWVTCSGSEVFHGPHSIRTGLSCFCSVPLGLAGN